MGTKGLREVADVLEQVLTDFGRRAADDPRRLKGLLTDTLGARASDLHDAIGMVVAAAEAGIPQAALSDTDRHALIDLARNHLPDPEDAEEVVDIWAAALRIQDRVPTDGPTVAPPVVPPMERTLAASDPTGLPIASGDPTRLPGAGDDSTNVMPIVGIPPAEPSSGFRDRVTSFTAERKAVVFSAAGILVLALGGIGAAAMWSGNGNSATTTTTQDAETTTSVGQTTTTVEPLAAIDHEEQVTSWGATVNRHWSINGDTLVGKVIVESGDEAIQGTIWEIFPDTWGVDATNLIFNTGDVLTAVHTNQTAVRLILDLPANTSWSNEYPIPLPAGGEDDPRFLETLLAEWESAMTEFLATPPPNLEVTSDRPVGDRVTFRGTTTPGAEVLVNGQIIEVAADGTFEHTVVLVAGENLVTVLAVDHVRGQSDSDELKWPYEPPVTTPTPTPTPSPTPTVTTPTVTTPTTTTTTVPETTTTVAETTTTVAETTTTPPPNNAPTATCGTQNIYIAGVFGSYWVNFPKSCFADSDGTVVRAFATQPNDGFGTMTQGNSNCTGAVWCWTYTPPGSWDGVARWVIVHVRGQDDDGAYSPYIQWNICINCSS